MSIKKLQITFQSSAMNYALDMNHTMLGFFAFVSIQLCLISVIIDLRQNHNLIATNIQYLCNYLIL